MEFDTSCDYPLIETTQLVGTMSFFGILKYNSVFVADESLDILQEQGFGAVSYVITVIAHQYSRLSHADKHTVEYYALL